ncbi:uncharacterized protein LOC124358056 isoform X2 [Homalodisca vitripennis]|uniref:uncharacterized protein LOC124358056 isoform X2 n=1 Tax=Homalodisca vitripennis TaxID=197043 RepID=UPI001EEB763B|nr:uncharacterized protein LOC124358056 isoform X2 [Homalodisca vitripennis]
MERHSSYDVQGPPPPPLPQQPEQLSNMNLTVVLPPEPASHTLRIDPPTFQMSMCSPHQLSMVEGDDIPPPKADFSAPPPYDLATKLPTYEEVQREKTLQGELPLPRAGPPHRPQTLAFLAIDTDAVESDGENSLLGTDFMFSLAFFGLLICVRAIIQYLNIKRGWRLLSGSAQERLLFFY